MCNVHNWHGNCSGDVQKENWVGDKSDEWNTNLELVFALFVLLLELCLEAMLCQLLKTKTEQ